MFSSGPNYTKLKTNLRLAVSRLKLLEKKKIELTQKSRKEIADYIANGKVERARIRVEYIIREDYMVEAMEMIEMYCDLLLARFGLIQQMRGVDGGIEEAIASVIWSGPRLSSDVAELKTICDQLILKYGKEFGEQCIKGKGKVNEKLQHRLGVQAPPKVLVEQYLIEISKNFNVPFEPDARIMKEAEAQDLLDLSDFTTNNLGGGGSGGGGSVEPPGFRGYPQPPLLPSDYQPFNNPHSGQPGGPNSNGAQPGGPNSIGAQPGGAVSVGGFVAPISKGAFAYPPTGSYNIPVDEDVGKPLNFPKHYESLPPSYSYVVNANPPDDNRQTDNKPKPSPRGKMSPPGRKPMNNEMFPELPNVPDEMPNLPEGASPNTSTNIDDIDFDDLNRRFENLKKS